jgi:hypothetical protein
MSENEVVDPMAQVLVQARTWAIDNGLHEPLNIRGRIEDFGFVVEAMEKTDKERMAVMKFSSKGEPTMYELAKW